MMSFLNNFFSSEGFMPHGHCYLWRPEIVWLHVVSDALIVLAYLSIPVTLWYFSRRRPDLPFHWIFVAFGVFIFSCGGTHLMEIITVWRPVYRLGGFVKAITAVASITTAVGLVGIIPKALSLRSPKELQDLNDRLHVAETALQRRVAELTAANAELEAFSYTVSHDLRAPLRAIDGFSQVVAEDCAGSLTPEAAAHLRRIRANTQTMGRLIDDLLSLSQLGRKKLEPEELNLREMVGDLTEEIGLAHPKATFEVGELPTVNGDRTLFRQVFFNLIGNGVKYASIREHPHVTISSHQDAETDAWVISIKDNGIGFDEKYSDKLFKVFERLHGGDRRFEGTGIGLSIVQRVVQRHGGRVWAQSRPDEGANFQFTIPVRPT